MPNGLSKVIHFFIKVTGPLPDLQCCQTALYMPD